MYWRQQKLPLLPMMQAKTNDLPPVIDAVRFFQSPIRVWRNHVVEIAQSAIFVHKRAACPVGMEQPSQWMKNANPLTEIAARGGWFVDRNL